MPARSSDPIPMPDWLRARLRGGIPEPEWLKARLRAEARRGRQISSTQIARWITEGQAQLDEIQARRQAVADRHSAERARGRAAYDAANRRRAARLGAEPATAIAASLGWWDNPPRPMIW